MCWEAGREEGQGTQAAASFATREALLSSDGEGPKGPKDRLPPVCRLPATPCPETSSPLAGTDRLLGNCVSAPILGLLPLPSQTTPPPPAGLPSQPPRPWTLAQPGPGRGRHAGPSFSFVHPPSLPRWGACLPQRLFTECPARWITSEVLDAGTNIGSSFPLSPQDELSGLLTVQSLGRLWDTIIQSEDKATPNKKKKNEQSFDPI